MNNAETFIITESTEIYAIIGNTRRANFASLTRCKKTTIAQLYNSINEMAIKYQDTAHWEIYRTFFYNGKRVFITMTEMLKAIENGKGCAEYA